MQLQPVQTEAISAPGGNVLILDCLNGNRFGCTMGDGHYGELEVSPQSLQSLCGLLHEVLQCFKWKGPAQHGPSA
jgi:hypothetical protein